MASRTTVREINRAEASRPAWLRAARTVAEPGVPCLAFETAPGDIECVALGVGLTWIGRSFTARVRLEDPTVSRLHAVLHRNAERVTVADDRSAEGVFVNGVPVEWCELEDGDALGVGRFTLFFLHG